MTHTFEDKIGVINRELQKRRSKWFLSQVTHIDFDDVSQIIRAHIHKKWHLWDQSKPLEPWLNRVISNQIKNLIRNNYGVFAKPCVSCPFNESSCHEEDLCSFTMNGQQNQDCPLYAKWLRNKQGEFHIKMPSSYDAHDFEIGGRPNSLVDLPSAVERMHKEMQKRLTPKQYLAYRLLFIENVGEEVAAKQLGYKTSEKNRIAGYRQIKNLKRFFWETAKKILDEEDVIYV